jgi:hypothetical protein
MSESFDEKRSDPGAGMDRRELFRTLGRAGAAAALAALAAVLSVRNRTASGETCINTGLCSSCSAFGSCRLPQALVTRQAMEGA